MKNIQPVVIWDNGKELRAKILNAYAINVTLGASATFYYALYAEDVNGNLGNQISQGNLTMAGQSYQEWTTDNVAWDWVAQQLNLVITGDYLYADPVTTP